MAYHHRIIADNATVALNGTSLEFDVKGHEWLEVIGTCTTGTGTMTLQLSSDKSTWYDSSNVIVTTAGSDHHGLFNVVFPWARFKYNQIMTGLYIEIATYSAVA